MADEPGTRLNPLTRRTFLAACAPLAASCIRPKAPAPGPEPVALPLDRFPDGVRVTVDVSGHPVEVLRSASSFTARSLLCSHQGCEVSWKEAEGAYACPCHQGRFDAEGRPTEGPPPKPLAVLATRVEGSLLLVGP